MGRHGIAGEPSLDGIVEHQSLEMIMNQRKTSFQTGDAVFMQTPERCEETYVVSIEKMWQEGEDPEKEANPACGCVANGTIRYVQEQIYICQMLYLMFLSLQKACVSRKLISNTFAGIISKRMLLNSMSKNDLLLTNHCNVNDVCTILLGKCTVLDRSSEEGYENTRTWVSRFSAIMAAGWTNPCDRQQIGVTLPRQNREALGWHCSYERNAREQQPQEAEICLVQLIARPCSNQR